MSMIEFHWTPDPAVVAHELRNVAEELEDLDEPLAASIPAVGESYQRVIQDEGHGEWPPWAESYAPYAETRNVGMLWRDGHLIESLTEFDNFLVGDGMLIFTGEMSPDYWIWHQEGIESRQKGGKLPARPFIEIDDAARAEVIGIFEVWLTEVSDWSITPGGQLRSPTGRFGPRL